MSDLVNTYTATITGFTSHAAKKEACHLFDRQGMAVLLGYDHLQLIFIDPHEAWYVWTVAKKQGLTLKLCPLL